MSIAVSIDLTQQEKDLLTKTVASRKAPAGLNKKSPP